LAQCSVGEGVGAGYSDRAGASKLSLAEPLDVTPSPLPQALIITHKSRRMPSVPPKPALPRHWSRISCAVLPSPACGRGGDKAIDVLGVDALTTLTGRGETAGLSVISVMSVMTVSGLAGNAWV